MRPLLDPDRVPGFDPAPLEGPWKATARALFRWLVLVACVTIAVTAVAYFLIHYQGFAEGPTPK